MMAVDSEGYQIGLVKWFGGYNYQKSKENDFGFITPIQGDDLFVHKSEIQNGSELKEDELVVFEVGENRGKQFAKNVQNASTCGSTAIVAFRIHINNEAKARSLSLSSIEQSILKMVSSCFTNGDIEFIALLNKEAHENPFVFRTISRLGLEFFEEIAGERSISELIEFGVGVSDIPKSYISKHKDELIGHVKKLNEEVRSDFLNTNFSHFPTGFSGSEEFLSLLSQAVCRHPEILGQLRRSSSEKIYFERITRDWSFCELLGFGVRLQDLRQAYIAIHEKDLFSYINKADEQTRLTFLNENILEVPINIVLTCGIIGNLIDDCLLAKRLSELDEAITGLFKNEGVNIPDHLMELIRSSYSQASLRYPGSVIWQLMEPLLFKKHLFAKSLNLKEYFDGSLFLKSRVESFVLANLFPLIQENSDLGIVYDVFCHRLWESLVAEEIDVKDEGVFSLFPPCPRMGEHKLSCEAFYWLDNEIFLCRGKKCTDPQVLPYSDKNSNKHYLDFNMYDWFKHYGVNYSVESQPSRRDFPVKVAAYFNRLKEIFERLHCRVCEKLMKPDRRYARTEYYEYRSGGIEKVNTSAAYRLTVFHCGNSECSECDQKYYINHCMGFGCYDIIDSRDAKVKCENGLYICVQCGSCCSQHGESNRVGLCPKCGSNLNLFENSGEKDHFGKYARYVQCSNEDCDFEKTYGLPKKFFMQTCQPVRQVNHAPKPRISSGYAGYRAGNHKGCVSEDTIDDEVPF